MLSRITLADRAGPASRGDIEGIHGEFQIVHSQAFFEGLDRAAFDADVPGLLIWGGGCPPLFGVRKDEPVSTPLQEQACFDSTETIRAALRQDMSIPTILVIGRWTYYAQGLGVGRDAHNWIELTPANGEDAGTSQADFFACALSKTVAELAAPGRDVFLLRQVPEIFDYSARAAAQAIAYGRLDPGDIETGIAQTSRADLDMRTAEAEAAIKAATDRQETAQILDPWPRFCDATGCSVFLDGRPVYFDNNHITNAAAITVRDIFRPVFAPE